MGDKQQAAGLPCVLAAKAPVVQRRNHRLSRARGRHDQVAHSPVHLPLRAQLIQDFLLEGVRLDVHRVKIRVVGIKIPLRLQRLRQRLLLLLRVHLKFAGVPIALKSRVNFVDRLRKVRVRHLYVPLQAAGNRRVGKVGGSHIGRSIAGITKEHVGFGMQSCPLGIVADLDLGTGKLAQLLHRLDIGGPHVGSRDHAQLSAFLRKLGQLVDQQAQSAPFDKGNQHVDPVAGEDFLFQLGIHLRLVKRARKETGLRDGCLRPHEESFSAYGLHVVLPLREGQQLFRALGDGGSA